MALTIGERLKSARKERGVSLQEATKSTKIQRRILEAIEEDRITEALDPAYAKISLKKYATFLGLDGLAVAEEYSTLLGSLPERPLRVETEATRSAAPPALRQILIPVGAGLMALIGLSFLGYLAVDLYGSLASSRSARGLSAPISKKAPSSPGSETTSRPLVPSSQPLKLTIRVKSDVWMQVKSDGAVIFQNVLRKGSQESWIAKRELELWTGNAGAMELVLNGKPLEGLGRGVKKGIRVTHKGLEVPE